MKIHTLDLNYQGVAKAIASYLVEGEKGWLLVETGPMSTLPAMLAALEDHGLEPKAIKDVLVTHIHLDHAGAAGWWAQQGARIYVHHVGARHLIDPSRLWESASRIYGDQMEQLWGSILPAPRDRVIAVRDGDEISAAGLTLTALDTPGHASHHHVYRLGDIAFSGDAAGVRTPGGHWVSLPAPPPEFDRETWFKTLERIEAESFDALYLTHFGQVEDIDNQLQQLRTMMEAAVGFIHEQMESGADRDTIVARYVAWNREQALAAGMPAAQFDRYEAANPLYMSVDGIMRYWRKRSPGS